MKAEGRSPEGPANDGGNGGEGTLYFVIHLIDGHGPCYGDFQQMVGIQARVEKESRKGEASGNDAHSMDTERVLIDKLIEKKFMAECPTGVPNVQELWILPWSANDVTPRSEGNRTVAPTSEELEGFTRLIKAIGSIPVRHDMVSLMIPKTPHADWQNKMVQGGAYPVFTQIANVALLGMRIIRGRLSEREQCAWAPGRDPQVYSRIWVRHSRLQSRSPLLGKSSKRTKGGSCTGHIVGGA